MYKEKIEGKFLISLISMSRIALLTLFFMSYLLTYGQAQAQYKIGNLDLDGKLNVWYDSIVGLERTSLIDGSFYPFRTKALKTHEYFVQDKWDLGTLIYKGQVFEVNMLYNVFQDLLIIQNTTNTETMVEPLKLSQNLVSRFEINSVLFVRLEGEEAPEKTGFYQLLADYAQLKVFVKRMKSQTFENGEEGFPSVAFYELDYYYLMRANRSIRIKNKKAFFQMFDSHKVEIKEYIRANNLLIKPGNDVDIMILTKFCSEKNWEV